MYQAKEVHQTKEVYARGRFSTSASAQSMRITSLSELHGVDLRVLCLGVRHLLFANEFPEAASAFHDHVTSFDDKVTSFHDKAYFLPGPAQACQRERARERESESERRRESDREREQARAREREKERERQAKDRPS